MTNSYLVWVGGVEIELYTGEHAEVHANETAQYFKWQGYDDVQIERVA